MISATLTKPEQKFEEHLLWKGFINFSGFTKNTLGQWPLSYIELSRPTGRYIRRIGIWILNLLLRKHEIRMVGNTCAPGLFFAKTEEGKGIEQFYPVKDCRVLVVNVAGETQKPNSAKTLIVFEAEPFMLLDLRTQWLLFEDYLAAMHSKYRVRAKKALTVSPHIGYEQYEGKEIKNEVLKTCSSLLAGTLRKKTIAMSTDLHGILTNFRNTLGDDFHLHIYKQENTIVGFITWVRQGDQMIAMHVGYDPDVAENSSIYQRILYDLVKIAIEKRIHSINFGRTATEIKSTLGARPLQNSFYVFIKNPFLRWCTKMFKKYLFTPEVYVLREPFRH